MRPFRYDLDQTPYDYIVEVMKRLKGLDLVDRVLEEQWTDIHNIVQEAVTKTSRKTNARQSYCLRRASQIVEKRGEAKGQRRKGRIHPTNAEFLRIARRGKRALSEQCREREEKNRTGKTRDLFKKIRDTKGTFHIKICTIKDKQGSRTQQKQKRLRRGGKNTQKICTKKVLMSQITTMVWSVT